MSENTEWLSVSENLIYCTGQKTHYNDYKLLLNTVQVQEQVTPKSENRKSSPCSIFGDTFTINTLLFHKYINDLLI